MACDDQGSNSVVTDLRLFVAPTATALLKIAKGVKGGISVMAPEDQTEQPAGVKNHGWDTERDPVCGMMVDPKKTKYISQHDGRTFYFCSSNCRQKFESDPDSYARSR